MTPTTHQIGGDHYKGLAIQPGHYAHANGLGYYAGAVVKYVTRYKAKNGREDLEKAIHCLQLLIDEEYGEAPAANGNGLVFQAVAPWRMCPACLKVHNTKDLFPKGFSGTQLAICPSCQHTDNYRAFAVVTPPHGCGAS